MLHRFPMTSQQVNAAILTGSVVSLAICVATSGTLSFMGFVLFALGLSILGAKKNAEAGNEARKESLTKIAALYGQDIVLRNRLRELDLAQISKYSAELQNMPEAQRIVSVHQAMEAWKALGRPSTDLTGQS